MSVPAWPVLRIRRVAFGGYDVKTTGLVGQAGRVQQIVLRGMNQAMLLGPINALCCAAPMALLPVAHFDEYYCIAVAHDQIKLALSAPIIACQTG